MNRVNTKKTNAGITLIEIIVVIAILGFIMSLGILFNFNSFKGYIFRSERGTLLSVLDRARSRAMTNFYQKPHGVCFDNTSKNYVIFRGNTYSSSDPTNETVGSNQAVSITSSPATFPCGAGGVVFAQLTGKTSPVDIVLTEEIRTSTIAINYEGTINW